MRKLYCAVHVDSKAKKKAAGPLFQIHWWRVVLDEAQSIKNAATLMAHAAHSLQVQRAGLSVIDCKATM